MRISDWSSDVCSSDLVDADKGGESSEDGKRQVAFLKRYTVFNAEQIDGIETKYPAPAPIITATNPDERDAELDTLFSRVPVTVRSEEHTSELQSLMRISYAVFCLKKKKNSNKLLHNTIHCTQCTTT